MLNERWTLSVGEGVFHESAGWIPLDQSRPYLAQLIMSMRPRDRAKPKVINQGILSLQQCDFKLQLRCFLSFSFLTSWTSQTNWPILTHNGSIDALWRKDVPSGVRIYNKYNEKATFPPQFPLIRLGVWKRINVLRHVLTKIYELYPNPCSLQYRNRVLTKNTAEMW